MVRLALPITGRVIAVLLCAVSLTVCALSVVGWVRGYWAVDVFERVVHTSRSGDSTSTIYRVSSGRGVVAFTFSSRRWASLRPAPNDRRGPPPDFHSTSYARAALRPDRFHLVRQTAWQKLGFHRHSRRGAAPGSPYGFGDVNGSWGFRVPYWLVVPLAGILPVISLRRLSRLRRHFRTRRGLCGGCGYDLRASRERCPECGEAVAPSAAPAPPAAGVAT